MTREEGAIGECMEFSDGKVVVRTLLEHDQTLTVCESRDTAIVMFNGDGKTQFTFTEELRS